MKPNDATPPTSSAPANFEWQAALAEQIKKHEQAIESLRKAEQKYRSIFENAIEGIFQTTPDGHYLDANPALARMYGYDSPKELTAALTDISRQLYVENNRRGEFVRLMREQGRVSEFESQIYCRGGGVIWISENARAVRDEVTGELLYYEGTVIDITRRKQAEAELRAKNDLLQADLAIARDIQQVFLTLQHPSFPPGASPEKACARFCHRYRPTQSVGGDFFSVLPLSDTTAGVFICDVMGHGLRAALVTAIVRGLVEELRPIAADAGRFLTEINRGLLAIFGKTDSPMLASAFYLVLDVAVGRVTFANAGHPSPLHLRRAAGTVDLLSANDEQGPVLGLLQDIVYRVGQCDVAARDLMMLFTDGLYEVEGCGGEIYGKDRLLAAAHDHISLPAEKLFDLLLAEIEQFAVRKEFEDDVCLIGVEVLQAGV